MILLKQTNDTYRMGVGDQEVVSVYLSLCPSVLRSSFIHLKNCQQIQIVNVNMLTECGQSLQTEYRIL